MSSVGELFEGDCPHSSEFSGDLGGSDSPLNLPCSKIRLCSQSMLIGTDGEARCHGP